MNEKEQYAELFRTYRRKHNATDDDLRSWTLAAIRGAVAGSSGSIDEIRAALEALDDVLSDPGPQVPTCTDCDAPAVVAEDSEPGGRSGPKCTRHARPVGPAFLGKRPI